MYQLGMYTQEVKNYYNDYPDRLITYTKKELDAFDLPEDTKEYIEMVGVVNGIGNNPTKELFTLHLNGMDSVAFLKTRTTENYTTIDKEGTVFFVRCNLIGETFYCNKTIDVYNYFCVLLFENLDILDAAEIDNDEIYERFMKDTADIYKKLDPKSFYEYSFWFNKILEFGQDYDYLLSLID